MDDEQYFFNKSYFFSKHQKVFAKFPNIYNKKARWLGTFAMAINKNSIAYKYFFDAIRINPLSIYVFIILMHIFLGFLGVRIYVIVYKIYNSIVNFLKNHFSFLLLK
jgi:hypothetical protein